MYKGIIDVQAVIEKKRQALLAEFEAEERNRADREARSSQRRAERLAENLAGIDRWVARNAERLLAAIDPHATPALVGDWLLMDSWSHEEGLQLLAGLQPAAPLSVITRARHDFYTLEDRVSGKIRPSDIPRCLRTLEGLELWKDYSEYLDDWEEIRRRTEIRTGQQLNFITRIWETGTHPERPEPLYFINWAIGKGIQVDWLQWAIDEGFLTSASANLQDAEGLDAGTVTPSSLKKQVAALALLLAEKSGKYKKGDKPNAYQIAEAVGELLDAMPDANTRGVGKSSIRDSIKAGLSLLTE